MPLTPVEPETDNNKLSDLQTPNTNHSACDNRHEGDTQNTQNAASNHIKDTQLHPKLNNNNNNNNDQRTEAASATTVDYPLSNAHKNTNYSKTHNHNNNNNRTNGLKNRILQRPPPLILDKVSNFSLKDQLQHQQGFQLTQQTENLKEVSNNQPSRIPDDIDQCRINNNSSTNYPNNNNNNQETSAKQKFWASLSETRNANALARQSKMPNPTTTTTTNKSELGSKINLGPDLIVTHRDSSNILTNHGVEAKIRNFEPPYRSTERVDKINDNMPNINRNPLNGVNDANNLAKCPDVSNGSEHDDSSAHGGGPSETGGGNLIGVDNSTPPASSNPMTDIDYSDAATPRSRSNNPFLMMDDADAEPHAHNNFHRRPASFMAATGASSLVNRTEAFRDAGKTNSQMPSDQFSRLQITDDDHDKLSHNVHIDHVNNVTSVISTSQSQPGLGSSSMFHRDRNDCGQFSQPTMPQDIHLQGINYRPDNPTSVKLAYDNIYASNNNYIHHGPTISSDSENTICKPPPSATLPLPHWTEAIYELNNAILDSGSVAGGSENGQLIYMVNSGDIILELDHIKVSGFTLVEFNELVESKPTHLLSAVQTKHSHSLTTDLQQYLGCVFPKDSADKILQDVIRENIYRRTIPCTTRPPKEGEVDKVDYHFLTKEQFTELNRRGLLLESGIYGGHSYGTMRPSTDISILSQTDHNSQHPMIDSTHPPPIMSKTNSNISGPKVNPAHSTSLEVNPFYENHESLRTHLASNGLGQQHAGPMMTQPDSHTNQPVTELVDQLPPGWEKVFDPTHGIFYVDHNSQRTQYERPYEIELTKGYMGFGFTLIEADNGLVLVRSIIPGGPAHIEGSIRPGDILVSAVGIPVYGLEHTDIAKLFSTFVVGDRVKLIFARGSYVVDANLVPDEYLFSNGTNGDMAYPTNSPHNSEYHHMPLYSNTNMIKTEPIVPPKPVIHLMPTHQPTYQNNFYANNEEIALQRMQYANSLDNNISAPIIANQSNFHDPNGNKVAYHDNQQVQIIYSDDGFEYHQIDLDRDSTDSNWGIRLIGGAEVNRAISIGSVVFGGAAAKNGRLKSGDEIISINGIDVVGATHQYVVEVISKCANRASLVVRRKKFAEACDVVLTRNMDEGFGFVIISSGNCALIGRIIEGSPADRCQQLHVKDRIIAVNGRDITPSMQHPEIVNMIKESGSTLLLRIVPADCYTVELIKNSPNDNFGFRMRGGSEFDGMPLYILKVASNGLARDLLNVGDQIIEINGIPTVGMTHQQAASIIKHSDPIVKLKLRRNYVTPPSLLVDSPRALQKYTQVTAEMKPVNVGTSQTMHEESSASSEFGSISQPPFPAPLVNEPHVQNMPLYAT